MHRIIVSPEMLTLVGEGEVLDEGRTALHAPVAFLLHYGALEEAASLRMVAAPSTAALNLDMRSRIILLVERSACERIAGGALGLHADSAYFLPGPLRAIALAIRDCAHPAAAAEPYRLAKSIELLCEILRESVAGRLVPIGQDALLSRADSERLLRARRMIEERWAEKLTLDAIARACGLNRAKLTRGFRDLFDCSVADAIATQRLDKAGEMLVATDLPVSSIGYRCGYLNNTSFTRAFVRRFGIAPTQYRMHRLAA